MRYQLINMNRIYETYFPLPFVAEQTLRTSNGNVNYACSQDYLEFIQFMIVPLIQGLKYGMRVINWYQFLWHPLPDKSGKDAIHIRMEVPRGGLRRLKKYLPKECVYTKKIPKKVMLGAIEGVNKNLLKDDDLQYAWWIIGQGSKWVIEDLIHHHKYLSIKEVRQFIHFYDNQLFMIPYTKESRLKRFIMKVRHGM